MKIPSALVAFLVAALLSPVAMAFTASGFSKPYGVTVNTDKNYVYVSNMSGAPNARGDSGFISRLKGDGSVDKTRFIDGASPGVTLNAPKGMAVTDGRIYVADIEKLRAFDEATGKFLFDVNFGDLPVQHFYDVTLGPDKNLYVADGPANVIYRIDVQKQHEVTVFISDSDLGQPHGIVWYPGRQVFAVAGWSSGQVTAYDRSGTSQTLPAILLRTLEGIASDDAGNLFVASSGLSAVYRIAANFSLETFWLSVSSPMGVAYSPAGNEIIAASSETNSVESRAVPDGSAKPQGAVMDYTPTAAPAKTPPEDKENGTQKTPTPSAKSITTGRPSASDMQKASEAAKPAEKPETSEEQKQKKEREEKKAQDANGG